MPDIRNIKLTQQVTNMFNAFVRGITYFASEAPTGRPYQPVYHRLGSCAPRGEDNPRCFPENTSNTRRVKKANIEKCYIERCIYDALWTRFVGTQDSGHLRWLQKTKNAYRTCFPDMDLGVGVTFDAETNLPVRLVVTASRDGAEAWEMEYTKYVADECDPRVSEAPVRCYRRDATTGAVSTRVSTFEEQGEWLEIQI